MEYDSPIRYRARSPTARARPLLESPVRTSATPFYSPARRTFVDDPVEAAGPTTTYVSPYRHRYHNDYFYTNKELSGAKNICKVVTSLSLETVAPKKQNLSLNGWRRHKKVLGRRV